MGRSILVLGASSEVGDALLREVGAGYDVVVAHYGRSGDRVEALRANLGERVVPVRADLAEPGSGAEVAAVAVAACGGAPDHVALLAAPPQRLAQFRKLSWDDFGRQMDVGVRAATEALLALLPAMGRRGSGRVVAMLSSVTMGLPPANQAAYVTAKYALLGLVRALSAEYAPRGVTVNGVSPDMMETRFLSAVPDRVVEMSAAASPRRRNVAVDEAVEAVAFLLSDGASGITGQNVGVTGGAR